LNSKPHDITFTFFHFFTRNRFISFSSDFDLKGFKMKNKALFMIFSLFLSISSLQAKSSSETDFRYAISNLVKQQRSKIVSIQIEKKHTASQRQYVDPFEQFFGPGNSPFGQRRGQQNQNPHIEKGLGSGVIVSSEGYILTNNHVVEGATKIEVRLLDDRLVEAEIVGLDKESDLAVIKIKKKLKNLPVAKLGDSENLDVGEWVVAIGNPFGLNHTVTSGIVSAKGIHGRGLSQYENYIQTDAAINPGNSGGALLNLEGELIGINSAILSKSGGFNGIGFAIPVNMAKRIMNELIENGSVTRGWLGIGIQDLSVELAENLGLANHKGVMITEIMEDSPASKSKLKVGDVLLSVNGKTMKNSNQLRNSIALVKPGAKVKFKISRDGGNKSITVKIGNREGEEVAEINEGDSKIKKSFGVRLKELTPQLLKQLRMPSELMGVYVQSVGEGSSANKSGLKVGDVILRVNHTQVRSVNGFNKAIAKVKAKGKGLILVQRGRARLFLPVHF
jgi:serine protease Do